MFQDAGAFGCALVVIEHSRRSESGANAGNAPAAAPGRWLRRLLRLREHAWVEIAVVPSPIGHAIAGLTVHALLARDEAELGSWRRAAVIVAAALAPDLDLLLHFVDGRNHHQMESHSIGMAALALIASALLFRKLRWPRPRSIGIGVGLGWISHLLLDFLNRDTNPPIGLLALWPFSDAYYKIPWPVFLDISRRFDWVSVRNNVLAIGWELVVLLPVFSLAWRVRLRSLQSDGRRRG